MLKKIKEFFMGKPAEVAPTPAPYKVETATPAPIESVLYKVLEPAVTTPIPLVVEPAPAQVVDQVAVVNAAEGSAIIAPPEKKARKPRAPKAVPAVKEKAPAKAKAPKAAKSKKA